MEVKPLVLSPIHISTSIVLALVWLEFRSPCWKLFKEYLLTFLGDTRANKLLNSLALTISLAPSSATFPEP